MGCSDILVKITDRDIGGASSWTYKLVIHFNTSQNESNTGRAEQSEPLFLVCFVDVCSNVACPIDSSGFGVSNVVDVVDMSCSQPQISDPIYELLRKWICD